MMGPMEGALGSSPLRTTLPMEVVTVSRYISPIASCWMMQLELILQISGVVISPMVPTDVSWLTSDSSSIFKQAMTPAKPQSGEVSYPSANSLVSEEDAGGEGGSGEQIGDHTGVIWENGQDLPLALDTLVGWGVPPVANSTSCLVAGGPSTWLNMVLGGGWGHP